MAVVGSVQIYLDVRTGAISNFTRAANTVARDSANMRKSLTGVGNSFSDSLRRASQATAAFNGHLGGLAAHLRGVSQLFDGVGTSAVAVGVGLASAAAGMAAFVSRADSMRRMANNLRTVTDGATDLRNVQEELFNISQRARAPLEGTVTLYARTARALEHLGTAQSDVLRITETVQKAFAVGGASAAEAQGAAIQLSQGIASDRFSGEEFRSVSENAPVLLRAMATQLGVNIGQLREMAHAGELTGEVVAKSILGASRSIDEDFGKTVSTVEQSFVRLRNATDQYIYDVDSAFGVTENLAKALNSLADNFDSVGSSAGLALSGLAAFGIARAGVAGGRALAGSVSGARANALDELKAQRNLLAQIEKERIATIKAIADEEARSATKLVDMRLAHTNALASARAKEVAAHERVNRLVKDRVEISQRVVTTQVESTRQQRELQRNFKEQVSAGKDLVRAQASYIAAQRQSGTVLEASNNERQRALRTVADLENKQHDLNRLYKETERNIIAAERRTTLWGAATMRVGGFMRGVWGALGGLPGVTLTAGIFLLMNHLADAQRRAAQYGEAIKKAGEDSQGASGGIRSASEELAKLSQHATEAARAASLAQAQADFEGGIERLRIAASGLSGVLDRLFPTFGLVTFTPAVRSVNELIDRFEKGELAAEDFNKAIDQISRENPDNSAILRRIQEIAEQADAARGMVDGLTTSLREALGELGTTFKAFFGKGDRVGSGIINDQPDLLWQRLHPDEGVEKLREDERERRRKKAEQDRKKAADAANKAAEDAKKLREGLLDLELDALASGLDEWNQNIIKSAQSLGIARSEIEQYIEAVSTGDLEKVPEIFERIAAAQERAAANEFARAIKDMQVDTAVSFLSEVDQELVEMARAAGIAYPRLQEIISLLQSGSDTQLPDDFRRAREELLKMAQIDLVRDTLKGFFSDLYTNLRNGEGLWQSFSNAAIAALDRLSQKLFEMATDHLINNLLGTLFGGLGGGAGGSGGFSAAALSGASSGIGLYDSGGTIQNGRTVPYGPKTRRIGGGLIADSGLGPRHFPAILEEGESVLAREMMDRTSSVIDGLAKTAGSSDGGTVVQIIDNVGVQKRTEKSRGPDGREMVKVILERVKEEFATGGFDPAAKRYGLRPTTVTR